MSVTYNEGGILLTNKEHPIVFALTSEAISRYGYKRDGDILEAVTVRLLAMMFAAFDTTALTLTQAILDLLYHDQSIYAARMREEAYSTMKEMGHQWTQASLQSLELLERFDTFSDAIQSELCILTVSNSFIRESQRLHPIGMSLSAKTLLHPSGWTFSNGDYVPFGATVALPAYPLHRDPKVYDQPDEFHGFRFVGNDKKTSSRPDQFLAFGYGRHSW